MSSRWLGRLGIYGVMNRDNNLVLLIAIMVTSFVLMASLRPDRFLTLDNFDSMAYQFPEFGIMSIAMMLTMLTGGIDLSIVGMANLSGVFAALAMARFIPEGTTSVQLVFYILGAVILSLATGLACGLVNGLLISRIGIPPILATLGTMQLFTGIAIIITKGYAVFGFPEQFTVLGNEALWIFPIPFIIFVVCASACAVMLNKTSFGLKLYMMGTNPTASKFSGINNAAMLVRTYMLSGLLAAIAGLVVIARTNSAKADYGTSYTLQAILISVMGGVNPSGGFGTISGIVLAVLTLQFLSSGFNMLRFSNFFKDFVWGATLLAVMVMNYLVNNRRSRSRALGLDQREAIVGESDHIDMRPDARRVQE
ncbi:MAG TPA: ABC transporter permease [Firmicutes bacterium]|nr:ABC transporter permease [Bacillota bacterium]